VRFVADENAIADVDAILGQLVHLGKQRRRIDDDAVADDARDARVQDARRNQPQNELRAVHEHGVARVVSALIARDDREMRREEIDDLAFPFVAPLRAQHNEIHKRRRILLSTASRRATAEHAEIAEKYFDADVTVPEKYSSAISAISAVTFPRTSISPILVDVILLDGSSLTIEQLIAIADRGEPIALSDVARERVRASRAVVERRARRDEPAYGIHTG